MLRHAEIEIVMKASEAHGEGNLTDKMLIEIAEKAEPDGADKNADLMIDIAKIMDCQQADTLWLILSIHELIGKKE
jgi:hypothetical protein